MTVRVLAILLTGLTLVAPCAHLFELRHKIEMSEDDYFVVQRIYIGWWVVGLFLPAALLANLALAVHVGRDAAGFWFAVDASALIVLNLVIFVTWTQPVNKATRNWTVRPRNWDALRRRWEFSHAANAGVTFLAFVSATIAALRVAI